MAALSRGEVSDCSNPKLDVFMKDTNGIAIDVSELSFQIFEKVTTPGIPIQVFPPSGKEAVDLSLCPTGDKITTGRYHASYTVALDEPIGTHEIRWFTKLTPAAPEQTFAEEFEVLSEAVISPKDTYVSVAEVRAVGLNSDPPSDGAIQSEICTWQAFLERATRQWFRPIATEFFLDGTDSDALHLPVPIISIDEIRINDEEEALDVRHFRVYDGILLPDDRKNPRIKLVDTFANRRDIFTGPDRAFRNRFRKGRQNQFVKGTFGYVEANGAPPLLIKRALIKLVIEKLGVPLVEDPSNPVNPPPLVTGMVKEEWTDGHKLKYEISGGALKARAPGLAGITNDPEILRIITLYKAPIGMATPANPSTR